MEEAGSLSLAFISHKVLHCSSHGHTRKCVIVRYRLACHVRETEAQPLAAGHCLQEELHMEGGSRLSQVIASSDLPVSSVTAYRSVIVAILGWGFLRENSSSF